MKALQHLKISTQITAQKKQLKEQNVTPEILSQKQKAKKARTHNAKTENDLSFPAQAEKPKTL